MHAFLKVLNSTNKWLYVEILKEYLKLGLFLELKNPTQTDIYVNSQGWIWKWSLMNTTLNFSISYLKCLFIFLMDLKKIVWKIFKQ